MICSYSSPSVITGGLPEFSSMTLPPAPGVQQTVKGKGNRKPNRFRIEFSCVLPYPLHTSAFWKEGGRVRPGPFSSPAQLSLCPPPASSRWCPGSRCQPC